MSNVPQADADTSASAKHVTLLARITYWLPVLAAVVIFGQVALLGLRPALSERTRLREAEVQLEERYQRDTQLSQQVAAHLAARFDPIFLERQRRSRQLAIDLAH